MADVFRTVLRDPLEDSNTLLLGSDAPASQEQLLAAIAMLPDDLKNLAAIESQRIGPMLSGGPVYSDDKAPVEWLIDKSILGYAEGSSESARQRRRRLGPSRRVPPARGQEGRRPRNGLGEPRDRRLRPVLRRRPPGRRTARHRDGGRAGQATATGSSGSASTIPDEDELDRVGDAFGLHELALEDAYSKHQRPKLEDYDGSYFVVLKTAHYDDEREEIDFGEINMFLGSGYVIAVRHGRASDLKLGPPAARGPPGADRRRPGGGGLGDPRQGRRRLRAGRGRDRQRHRRGRAGGLRLARRRRDPADLLPAPRGDRVPPRRPAARRAARVAGERGSSSSSTTRSAATSVTSPTTPGGSTSSSTTSATC